MQSSTHWFYTWRGFWQKNVTPTKPGKPAGSLSHDRSGGLSHVDAKPRPNEASPVPLLPHGEDAADTESMPEGKWRGRGEGPKLWATCPFPGLFQVYLATGEMHSVKASIPGRGPTRGSLASLTQSLTRWHPVHAQIETTVRRLIFFV